jgi:TonB family protein
MRQESTRAYGFGMSRDAHIVFVTVYITILLVVAAFGGLRFWSYTSTLLALRNAALHATTPVKPNSPPVLDPTLGAHAVTYPPIAVKHGQEGVVTLCLKIMTDGTVGDASVVKSSGYAQLDASALVSVGYWRYRPAARNGKPVEADYMVRIRFRLSGRQAALSPVATLL